MEVIQTVFDQIQDDIHQKLKVLEKQVVFILSQNQSTSRSAPNDDFLAIKRHMELISVRLGAMEDRLASLERRTVPPSTPAAVATAGLEGLLMKPITLPSPALSARSENQVVVPFIQRQLVLNEEDDVEPDEEAVRGQVAEETGGLDEEEEAEEEEVVEEEVEEEEAEEEAEEEETVELEEFIWKGKTYFKTPDNMLYRANDEGDVEDEPFAKYDPKTNTVKRI